MMNKALLAELRQEAASTRKMLERVPFDQSDWKPHPKSMSLGKLACHVADLANWLPLTLRTTELNFAGSDYVQLKASSREELLSAYDGFLQEARTALEKATDEDLMQPWTLRSGEHILFTLPKAVVIRSMVFNHFIHHRGQLSVYLRLLQVPVPGMYGPSADDVE
ncbi:MAG TPA: DinB family protein [Chitinophagaceae bacterium]|jgi:uncharacterized damage-inducible protein DinB|nr:DinB family protein [Chitinophagaceae bacterium]